MDPLMIAVAVVAVLALTGVVVLWARSRRLGMAIDEALDRIGHRPNRRRYNRPAVLRSAVDRLEEATVKSERNRAVLAGAVNESPIGVIITDDHGVVRIANPLAMELLGVRRGAAVTEVRVREVIEQALIERMTVSGEIESYTPVRRTFRLGATALEHGVESAGVVAFITDVTEDRRVEAMRRDFVANVGHELKTPLGALAALAETLAGATDDPAVMKRLAERVEVEAVRLAVLVANILDLSQAEAMSARFEQVDLGAVAADSVALLFDRAEDAGVTVELRAEAGVLVAGDRRQLQTMIANLIDNAIEYSDRRDESKPSTVVIRIGVDGSHAVLDVEDDGIGIPESHVARLFERFYRVDQARSRETGGSGLGLSIVRNIAVAHGGTASVRSALGVGSTFTVELPLWSDR